MKKSLTFIFIIISINFAFGCTCAKGTYRFVDHIAKYSFVGLVEVIGKDTINGESIDNSKPFAQSNDYAFTVVKIINQYSGRYVGKEIKIIDSKGFECFTRLGFKNFGDKFIVKGFIADVNEYIYSVENQKPKKDILVLSLCDMNRLYVDGNEVTGWITVNKSNRWWVWTMFLKKITFGLIDRERRRKKFEPQRMGIDKFIELIKEKIEHSH